MSHETSQDQEQHAFLKIVDAFNHYRLRGLSLVAKRRRDYNRLLNGPNNQFLLDLNVQKSLDTMEEAVEDNYKVIRAIIEDDSPFPIFDTSKDELLHGNPNSTAQEPENEGFVQESDVDKVKSTLRQLVRDWSEEGRLERENTYAPMLEILEKLYPDDKNRQVLVPGAGLGRLAFEVVQRGYACQGNEFSFYMLLTSNFILNKCSIPNQFTIYPWIHSGSNHLTRLDQLRGVKIPDVAPGQALANRNPPPDFSMVAGDFYEVYDEEMWDCVMTCFFIDTSKNPIACLRKIYEILKPGGYWINLGPLLYHFEGMENETTLELSLDEILRVANGLGFEIVQQPREIKTTYCANRLGMMNTEWNASLWVARK